MKFGWFPYKAFYIRWVLAVVADEPFQGGHGNYSDLIYAKNSQGDVLTFWTYRSALRHANKLNGVQP